MKLIVIIDSHLKSTVEFHEESYYMLSAPVWALVPTAFIEAKLLQECATITQDPLIFLFKMTSVRHMILLIVTML